MDKRPLAIFVLLFILQFFLCTVCIAQREYIDSLKNLLPILKDTNRVNCLNELSEAYQDIQTDSARQYALKALSEAGKITYRKGTVFATYYLARSNQPTGTFSDMEDNCYAVLEFIKKNNGSDGDLQLARLYLLTGLAKWAQSKFDEAIETYKKAEDLCLKIGNNKELGNIYFHMSALEIQRGQYKNSLEYCRKGLPLWRGAGNDLTPLALLYSSLGDYQTSLSYYREIFRNFKSKKKDIVHNFFMGETFYLTKQYDSAIFYYRINGPDESKPYERSRRAAWYKSRMGEVLTALKSYDTAQVYLESALTYFQNMKDRNQEMWTLLRLARAHEAKMNYPKAIMTSNELLKLAAFTGARQHVRAAHFLLYKLFEVQQKKDSAYRHLQLYTSLTEIIGADQAELKLAIFKTMTEVENAQVALERLREEKQLQDLELRQASVQKYFLAIGMVLLVGIGLVLIRNIMLKRKSEKDKRELVEKELDMQRIEHSRTQAELRQQATELEMQALRAQMNPHFIFNSLNSINRFILQNSGEKASEYLIKFSKLVRLILQNSQLAWITLERELESLELYLQLEALRFEYRFEYKIIISKDLDVSALKVPPLITQPYAENAIWHGLMHKNVKGQLDITVDEQNGYLFFRIADDGIGRKKSAALNSKSTTQKKSLGSKITAERIAMLQRSTVTINDLVDHDGAAMGTEVIIKIPANYD